jgi:two-component system nitrogen regulation response regulator GlnG
MLYRNKASGKEADMKILIIDRDESTLFWYMEEFEEDGYEVVCLQRGHKMLETIAKESPDVLVLGIRIDGYGNFELLETAKATYPDLPVVFNTSWSWLFYEAKKKGADFVISKYHDLTELKKTIKTIEENLKNKSV